MALAAARAGQALEQWMERLTLFRMAVLIAMRDLLIPGGGLFLAVFLPTTHNLEPWHLPLIAGMLGTPLVARSDSGSAGENHDPEDTSEA